MAGGRMTSGKTSDVAVSLNMHRLKTWMLNNTSGFCLQLFHCNVLQIFIFNHIYFLAKDVFFPLHTDWQFSHWHLVIKKKNS